MCGVLTQGLGALQFTEFCLLPTLASGRVEAAVSGFWVLPLLCSDLADHPRGKGEVLCGPWVTSDVTPKPVVPK